MYVKAEKKLSRVISWYSVALTQKKNTIFSLIVLITDFWDSGLFLTFQIVELNP